MSIKEIIDLVIISQEKKDFFVTSHISFLVGYSKTTLFPDSYQYFMLLICLNVAHNGSITYLLFANLSIEIVCFESVANSVSLAFITSYITRDLELQRLLSG